MNDDRKRIWVISEAGDNGITAESRQLLSKAKELASRMNADVATVLPASGWDGERLRDTAGTHIYYCPHIYSSSGADCSDSLYSIINLVESICVLFIDNPFWKEVAVRLACRLNAGLIADCIDIVPNMKTQSLTYIRLAYSGLKKAEIVTKNNILGVCTAKGNVFNESTVHNAAVSPISETYIDRGATSSPKVRLLDRRPLANTWYDLSLNDKKVIFGIGNGVDTQKIDKLKEIAYHVNAGVGYSKPVVDLRNAPSHNQIGHSGKFIACDLYIAFGISGSIHHLCAIQKCKKVVAVNLDSNASICKFANISIIADANTVIDKLYQMLCRK